MADPNEVPPGYLTGQKDPGLTVMQNTNYSVQYVRTVKSYQDTTNEFTVPADRYWLSTPRRMDSDFWEVLLINFRNPVSVSAITFDLFEVAQHWEFWAYPNNLQKPTTDGVFFPDATTRIPILDRSLRHLAGHIDTGTPNKWYSYNFQINPMVIRTLELRLQRINDGVLDPSALFSVGVRNLLAKRQVYNELDAMRPLEPGVDPIGNLVESYVRKWEPTDAIDGDSFTFWKSAPQPSPDAVVSYYVDTRDDNGNAQRVDRLFMDPTHTGQDVNLYYSTDDTVGPRTLALNRLTPLIDTDTNWVETVGLDMSATTAVYQINTALFNVDNDVSTWTAFTWVPSFPTTSPPAVNLTLLGDPNNQFRIRYLSNLQQFEIKYGSLTVVYPCAYFDIQDDVNISLRVVRAGNSANIAPGLYWNVVNQNGATISAGSWVGTVPSFAYPSLLQLKYCQGYISKWFIKQDIATTIEVQAALIDMTGYLLPQVPELDMTGSFASSSLTNMVYGADFTMNELGFGGTDHLYFAEKTWTPIWVDWKAQRGFYYFPSPVVAKFLKIEFSNLTQEPYTIHESGINVQYASFPINVLEINQNIKTVTKTYVDTRTKQVSSTRGVLYDNMYSTNYTNTQTNNTIPVYFVNVGSPSIDSVPRSYTQPVHQSISFEGYTNVTSAHFAQTNSVVMAADAYYKVVSGDWLIKIGKKFNINWKAIYAANRGLVDRDPRVQLLPSRSPGWWIFPGQKLRIPNAIMERLTTTSTRTEKHVATTTIETHRNRFVKTEIHRYQYRTAERDAAIAYFAGLREIQVFRVNYTVLQDTEVYDFPVYDNTNFKLSNMYQYSYSGGWESSETPVSLTANYPGTDLFPGKTQFPDSGTTSYPKSASNWSDAFSWGGTNATWGFVPASTTGTVESNVWSSLSLVLSATMEVYDRGLYQQVQGKTLSAAGGASTGPEGYWDSGAQNWGDTVVVWGTRQNIVAAAYQSNIQFSGQDATSLYRPAGVGVAGLQCVTFNVVPHARVRVALNYFRPKATTNDVIMQLVDVTNTPGETILLEQKVNAPYIGQWSTIHTNFYVVGDRPITNAVCRILLSGADEELIYIGSVYPETTTIKYELSNDGGLNYYECTQMLWADGTKRDFVFPTLNSQLRMRATLYDPANDFVFGGQLTPRYV